MAAGLPNEKFGSSEMPLLVTVTAPEWDRDAGAGGAATGDAAADAEGVEAVDADCARTTCPTGLQANAMNRQKQLLKPAIGGFMMVLMKRLNVMAAEEMA
jgi:hypothetical protein